MKTSVDIFDDTDRFPGRLSGADVRETCVETERKLLDPAQWDNDVEAARIERGVVPGYVSRLVMRIAKQGLVPTWDAVKDDPIECDRFKRSFLELSSHPRAMQQLELAIWSSDAGYWGKRFAELSAVDGNPPALASMLSRPIEPTVPAERVTESPSRQKQTGSSASFGWAARLVTAAACVAVLLGAAWSGTLIEYRRLRHELGLDEPVAYLDDQHPLLGVGKDSVLIVGRLHTTSTRGIDVVVSPGLDDDGESTFRQMIPESDKGEFSEFKIPINAIPLDWKLREVDIRPIPKAGFEDVEDWNGLARKVRLACLPSGIVSYADPEQPPLFVEPPQIVSDSRIRLTVKTRIPKGFVTIRIRVAGSPDGVFFDAPRAISEYGEHIVFEPFLGSVGTHEVTAFAARNEEALAAAKLQNGDFDDVFVGQTIEVQHNE